MRAPPSFRVGARLIFILHGADSTSAVQPEPGEGAECGMTYYRVLVPSNQVLAYGRNPGRTKPAGTSGYQGKGCDVARTLDLSALGQLPHTEAGIKKEQTQTR